MKSALSFRNVSVRYRPEDPFVLTEISLDIAPGERVALLGLNGSGKTTLLYSAVGLVPFDGCISVCDVELSRATERPIRDNVGFLFGIPDDQILFPNVLDDISFTLERRGIPREEARQRVLPIMKSLGIETLASRSPHRLSHGQMQRVALAGALEQARHEREHRRRIAAHGGRFADGEADLADAVVGHRLAAARELEERADPPEVPEYDAVFDGEERAHEAAAVQLEEALRAVDEVAVEGEPVGRVHEVDEGARVGSPFTVSTLMTSAP